MNGSTPTRQNGVAQKRSRSTTPPLSSLGSSNPDDPSSTTAASTPVGKAPLISSNSNTLPSAASRVASPKPPESKKKSGIFANGLFGVKKNEQTEQSNPQVAEKIEKEKEEKAENPGSDSSDTSSVEIKSGDGPTTNTQTAREIVSSEVTCTQRSKNSASPVPASCATASPISSSHSLSLESIASGFSSFLRSTIASSQKSIEEAKKRRKMIIRPPICSIPIKEISQFCLSFSGCGFLGAYHFGACKCFVQNGTYILGRLTRVSGASAGSLVASMLLLAPNKIDACVNVLYDMADELNSLKFGALTPGYYLNERLIKIVDKHLPENIAFAEKKLFVSLTNNQTRKNELISSYANRDYLIRCLMASCYIPMYSMGYNASPPVIDGKGYVDGGYTNNLPDFDDVRTITISPFSGSAEISPQDPDLLLEWRMTIGSQQMKVNLQNIVRGAQSLFPPSRTVLQGYYERGYKDAFKFLLNQEIIERPTGTEV